MNEKRNVSVDVIRAIAMLLVVLGHTLSGSTTEYENTVVFKIVWSIQMPLFFVLSGYVTKYSKVSDNAHRLLLKILKKTCAYLIPWLAWTFFVKGVILGQTGMFNIRYLAFHMDSGYWFLFAIWVIAVLFEIGSFISAKITKSNKKISYTIITTAILAVFAVGLLAIGLKTGLDFLCIKLIVYYIPFYALGFAFGKISECDFYSSKKKVLPAVAAVSFAVWIVSISRFDLFSLEENIQDIAIRITSSVTGCVAVCWTVNEITCNKQSKIVDFFKWIGSHTLEIYLCHNVFLSSIKLSTEPITVSMAGFVSVAINYSVTLALTLGTIYLIGKNKILNKVLFWK